MLPSRRISASAVCHQTERMRIAPAPLDLKYAPKDGIARALAKDEVAYVVVHYVNYEVRFEKTQVEQLGTSVITKNTRCFIASLFESMHDIR